MDGKIHLLYMKLIPPSVYILIVSPLRLLFNPTPNLGSDNTYVAKGAMSVQNAGDEWIPSVDITVR